MTNGPGTERGEESPALSEEAVLASSEVDRLRRLATLLDSSIPLPGGLRVGIDGFIGLVPFVGDVIGASLSTYIVIKAAQLGATTILLLRMMLNVLVELIVGAVPLIGDLFDFAWKANNRNMALLDQHLPRASREGKAKKRLATAVAILLGAFILLLIVLFVAALMLLFGLVSLLV